jgi:hypothetical protein
MPRWATRLLRARRSGVGRLGADRHGFLALESHGLKRVHRERQLNVVMIPLDESSRLTVF